MIAFKWKEHVHMLQDAAISLEEREWLFNNHVRKEIVIHI